MLHLLGLEVMLPHAMAVTMAGVREQLPSWLQACLVELSAFPCIYIVGDGAWAVGGAVARLKGSLDVAEVSQNLWEHKEQTLPRLAAAAVLPEAAFLGVWRLQFDGGCRDLDGGKRGAGGYIAWSSGGQCLGGHGHFYGLRQVTNNAAEAQGLVDGMMWLVM